MNFFNNLIELSLAAAPWLVLGLLVGGMIKAVVPMSFLERHLGGNGIGAITKAALFGAPLPLCSCGVIPAALGLRRAGASKSSTVSFLVSTPETGVDSVAITYALMGPFMAITRPIAAIISAITAGLLVGRMEESEVKTTSDISKSDHVETRCCSPKTTPAVVVIQQTVSEPDQGQASCCGGGTEKPAKDVAPSSCCGGSETEVITSTLTEKFKSGVVYAFTDLYSSLIFWLVIGLLFAAAVQTFLPATFLTEWGSGLPAMIVMILIGIPMYVCASASTPIAAGFMLAGVSPGTALVFLMAGPATNMSTLGVINKELGRRALIAYLSGVIVIAILAGLLTDYLIGKWNIDIAGQLSAGQHFMPHWLAWGTLLILIAVAASHIKNGNASLFKPA